MTLLERLTKKYIVIEMREYTNERVKEAIDQLEEEYCILIFRCYYFLNGHF